MKISTLLFLLTIQVSVFAQNGRLKRADNYYNVYAYSLAAQEYESLIGSSADSPEMKSKLADSYYQMGELKKAEEIYTAFVTSSSTNPKDLYQYAQALKENGKYSESDNWMKKFVSVAPGDIRSVEYVNKENYLSAIKSQGTYFTIDTVGINSKDSDFGGYPSVDGKSVYFVSGRNHTQFINREWSWNSGSFLDLYSAKQNAATELTDPAKFSKTVNTKFHEGPLCFSKDGKKVYFTRDNISAGTKRKDTKGIQQLKIYIADVDQNGNWSNEQEFVYNSSEFSTGHPTLSEDGKYLYYVSSKPGGFGGADIYKVEIKTNGLFGPEINLGSNINTEGQEMFPWIGKDNQLFFSSDGHTGLGGLDIYVALVDNAGEISKILNVGLPINSSNDDFSLTMNSDGKSGFFSSNREGGQGSDDIYSFINIKPFKVNLRVEGIVLEMGTSTILPGADVYLMNEDGTEVSKTVANSKGQYQFDVEPNKNYKIQAKKKDYFDNTVDFTTMNLPVNTELVEKNVDLDKDPGIALHALVTDAASKLPLEGVHMKIVDNFTNTPIIDVQTPSSGDALRGLAGKKINDQISYTIVIQKEGYLSKTVVFNTKITQPGIINVENALDLTMQKIEVGGDLAKMIDIKPIYFDLSKYAIRPDAAKELDKIVKVMNEYPTMEIELGSHTDCRGSIASNEKLSDNRAKASAEYVRARITNPQRIAGKGYGESKLKNGCGCEGPVKSTCSEAEHQENRRTEFIITKM